MNYTTLDEYQKTIPPVEKKVRDHRGERNPHYGHKMNKQSRDAIATKQRLRFDLLRSAVEQVRNPITEDIVRQVVKEEIERFVKDTMNNNKANIPIDL